MAASTFDEVEIGAGATDLHDSIQIALANVPVDEKDVEASYLGRPRLGRARLRRFTNLLNEVSRYRADDKRRVDLVVFPEVSVPHAWESMLAAWARRHRIGVVCGLEHSIDPMGQALNQVLALLPYQTAGGPWACLPVRRLKRFYSPEEEFVLKNEGLLLPKAKSTPYHLFRWRGASFAIYNCFELASIEDRSLFKARVDFIVATEFNRDINYFSNIVESAARDLHCYVVQVNDSAFGDSRVVSPSKSEIMNPLRIKGGDNLTYLTMRIDLRALRTHQRKGYGLQKDSRLFKPTPPDFPMAEVRKRIALGK
jgi:predicted amidohydrolase